MTNEDFQKVILEQLAKLTTDLESITVSMATKDALATTNNELAGIKTTMATKDALADIKATMATKDDIARLERLANGTMEIIEVIYRDIETLAAKQDIRQEAVNIVHLRQLQIESELTFLRKAL